MTVQELINELSQFDSELDVFIDGSSDFIFEGDEDNNELNIELGD